MAKVKIGEIESWKPKRICVNERIQTQSGITAYIIGTNIGFIRVATWHGHNSATLLDAFYGGRRYHAAMQRLHATELQAVRLAREFAAEVMKLANGSAATKTASGLRRRNADRLR